MLAREFTNIIHFILDELLPPIVRDSKWLMMPLFRLSLGPRARLFIDFKSKITMLSDRDIDRYYDEINRACLDRPTDINRKCLRKISCEIRGETVLDVGAGRCFLARILAERYRVTALDVDMDEQHETSFVKKRGSIFELSEWSERFDTVICAHTIEHLTDTRRAMDALRSVTKTKLIVIVPKQRPYRFTFDTHLQFFPFVESFLMAVRPTRPYSISVVGGDIFYTEEHA